jgi:hypothetical protein
VIFLSTHALPASGCPSDIANSNELSPSSHSSCWYCVDDEIIEWLERRGQRRRRDARITSDLVLRRQIETACNEMLMRLADDFQRKAKVLKDGGSLIAAEADDQPASNEEA